MKKMNYITASLLILVAITNIHAQIYVTPLVGYSSVKSNIGRLQESYDSYIAYKNESTTNFTHDENWSSRTGAFTWGAQVGVSAKPLCLNFTYLNTHVKQFRNILNDNNYGRSFEWHERRSEVLIDIGYGSPKFDFFGSFGINMNNFTMLSYQVYPDGTKSLSSEYTFNGVFKQYDGGISYGFGMKIKPLKHVGIELRYLYANDQLIGEDNLMIADNATLTDNSRDRYPGTSEYPQNYQEPLSFDNYIIPNFSASYLQLTLFYYFNFK